MDINHVQLTPGLLSELYGSVLVEEPAQQQKEIPSHPSAPTQSGTFRWMGLHQGAILLLVKEPHVPFLSDESMAYLTKILHACQLTMNQVALVNLAQYPGTTYLQLQEKFPSQKIIGFGITPGDLELPIEFPDYQLQKLSGCTYLMATSLPMLESTETEKRKLWVALKKLFNR